MIDDERALPPSSTTTVGLRIERLGPSDLDALVDLEGAAQEIPWSRASLVDELAHADGLAFGARAHESLIAHLLVRRQLDEAWIFNLAVHPAWRRQGLAFHLLCGALPAMQGLEVSSIWLEVRASNLVARRLYRRFLMDEVAIRPGYYPPLRGSTAREAAVVMRRALSPGEPPR